MDPDRLRELLEASRPGDLDEGLAEVEALELRELLADDAELRAELERLHGWDAAIGAAMHEAPVPAGLASRLQAAVDQELANPTVEEKAALAAPPRPSRRAWLYTLITTAAALLIGLGLGAYWQQPKTVDMAALDQEARTLSADLESIAWKNDRESLPIEAFPDDVRVVPQRWGHVATSLDRQAVIFDLVRAGAPRAVVISMQANVASNQLPNRPRLMPDSSTAGACVGAWQQDDHIYLLVVSGNRARYQLFLRDAAPLTLNWPAPVLSH